MSALGSLSSAFQRVIPPKILVTVVVPSVHDDEATTADGASHSNGGYMMESLGVADRQRKAELDPSDFRSILFNGMREVHEILRAKLFFRGIFDKSACACMVSKYFANLRVIHLALEEVQKQVPRDSMVHQFIFEFLWRSSQAKADMEKWSLLFQFEDLEETWQLEEAERNTVIAELVKVLEGSSKYDLDKFIAPETMQYTEHLRQMLREDHDALVAPLFVFYGTFFFGGPFVGANVREIFDKLVIKAQAFVGKCRLERPDLIDEGHIEFLSQALSDPNHGASFFNFTQIENMRSFRDKVWHSSLNGILTSLPEERRDQFKQKAVVEANRAATAFSEFLDFITSPPSSG